ncbi:MAG: 6-phosphogluconolactonase [Deltaproteobacteria bacterium]|nr:6-phosphogluconolactonase [Deltaproteobacteria bacterium]MBW1873416.1 6-phosphogluconolactonase [Deltaproteobacteria bacterium]
MKTEVRRFPDLSELSKAAAEFITNLINTTLEDKDFFSLVLSGGNTPRRLYEILAAAPLADRVPWSRVHLFWGDERCVAQDHPDSNFKMANELLISKVALPQDNVHRIAVETGPPDEVARAYEQVLKRFFGGGSPNFDLVLLGMGKDGHTASLFPKDSVLLEQVKNVAAVYPTAASVAVPRITITFPAINRAACAMFLVSGKDKHAVFKAIIGRADRAGPTYPAALVEPREKLIWFVEDFD